MRDVEGPCCAQGDGRIPAVEMQKFFIQLKQDLERFQSALDNIAKLRCV